LKLGLEIFEDRFNPSSVLTSAVITHAAEGDGMMNFGTRYQEDC